MGVGSPSPWRPPPCPPPPRGIGAKLRETLKNGLLPRTKRCCRVRPTGLPFLGLFLRPIGTRDPPGEVPRHHGTVLPAPAGPPPGRGRLGLHGASAPSAETSRSETQTPRLTEPSDAGGRGWASEGGITPTPLPRPPRSPRSAIFLVLPRSTCVCVVSDPSRCQLPRGAGLLSGGAGSCRPGWAPLPARVGFATSSYLVDPASNICLSQRLSHAGLSAHGRYSETANGSLNQLWFL